jgi:pimeloyl-ACP methyl ester carboxylesterase
MTSRTRETLDLDHPEGGRLAGDLSYDGTPSSWAVLYAHGLGSTRHGEKTQAVEEACARRGWTFAALDFRGHGGSSGSHLELRGSGLLADLETAQAALAGRGIRRLCLVGSSMGGWASAWYTLLHPEVVAACVLIAPAFDFLRHRWSRLSEAERRRWRETGRLRLRNQWIDTELGYGLVEEIGRFPVERLAAELGRPLLIFHGMQDDTVPYEHSLALVQQAPYSHIELRLFKDGDHRLVAFKDDVAESACAFFARWPAV